MPHKTTSLQTIILSIFLTLIPLTVYAQSSNANSYPTVIIILKDQPQTGIAEQVWAEKQPLINQISADLRALDPLVQKISQQTQPLTRAEENRLVEQFSAQPIDPQFQQMLQQKAEQIDSLRQNARQEILQRSQNAQQISQAEVIQNVTQLGGQVIYRYHIINALAVRIPSTQRINIQYLPQVQSVYEDQIRQALLNHSVPSIGAPFFWNAGFTGAGVDVAILDTGIDSNHPALSGKVLEQKRCLTALDQSYNTATYDPTFDDVNGHGTHIAGSVASQDSLYRGVAYGVQSLINAKAGGDLDGSPRGNASMADSDAMECVEWAINGTEVSADVINLSFGSLAYTDDQPLAQFWDAVVSQMDIVASIAAGNNGYLEYTINSPGIAYDVLSVANIDDKNTSSIEPDLYYLMRSDDIIRDSSSRGPTYAGRKKPDLTAPGTNIISTNNTWETDNDFISYTGTSMAAPQVAGAAALVMSRGVSSPLAVKALMINTAQDMGTPGWDNTYGWGYLDLYNLNAHINDYFLDSLDPAPAFKLYSGPALTGDTATLVWNRRIDYSPSQFLSTLYPLTNLDLFAYNEADNNLLASSTSLIDNVEQVSFNSDLNRAVLKVKDVTPSIQGTATEPFALATQEDFQLRQGPHINSSNNLTGDMNGPAGTIITLTAHIQNDGDLMLQNPTVKLLGTSGLVYLSGAPTCFLIHSLGASQSSEDFQWVFQKSGDTPQGLAVIVNSFSYGELYQNMLEFGENDLFTSLAGHSLCYSFPIIFH